MSLTNQQAFQFAVKHALQQGYILVDEIERVAIYSKAGNEAFTINTEHLQPLIDALNLKHYTFNGMTAYALG